MVKKTFLIAFFAFFLVLVLGVSLVSAGIFKQELSRNSGSNYDTWIYIEDLRGDKQGFILKRLSSPESFEYDEDFKDRYRRGFKSSIRWKRYGRPYIRGYSDYAIRDALNFYNARNYRRGGGYGYGRGYGYSGYGGYVRNWW